MSVQPSLFSTIPFGPAALDALDHAISEAKAGDALAPVTVVTPSNYAGLSARRALGARHGLVNVRFLVAPRLAELVAAGRIPGKDQPLTPALRAEAIRAGLIANPGPFETVADHPGTLRALDATFRDLRETAPDDLDRLASTSARAAHVVALYRAFRERVEHYFDPADLFIAAAETLDATRAPLRDIGHVVLYLPREQTPGELAMLKALRRHGALSVVAPVTGESAIDAPVAALAQALEAVPALPPALAPSASSSVLAAADPDEEVRNVLRIIAAELDKDEEGKEVVPLHRIAVLYPSADPYAAIASELFAAANIPINGPGHRTLAASLAGRVVLALLAFAEAEFDRESVMDFLALPVSVRGSGRVDRRWELLAREAGVTRGVADWRRRLAAHAASLRRDAASVERDGRERLADRLRGDATHCDELLATVESLASEASLPASAPWPHYADALKRLLETYLPPNRLASDDEADAYRAVVHAIDDLHALQQFSDECRLSDVAYLLEQQLGAPWGRAGAFGNGVLLAPVSVARGIDADIVLVLGMVEGAFPRTPREDPLLPDSERAAAPALRAGADRRIRRDREDFLAACAVAPRRIFCFPASGLRDQRANLPSRWLLAVCSDLAGRTIFTEDLGRLIEAPAGADWLVSVPSFQSGIASDRLPPASALDYDLRSLLAAGPAVRTAPLVEATLPLRRGLDAAAARAGRAFTEWDGRLDPHPDFDPVGDEATSPTRLESWAACGFRYFLANVLRVQPTRDTAPTLRISPLDRGSLVHDVLEAFFRDRGPSMAPGDSWTASDRTAMRELAEAAFAAAEDAGRTGKPLLWRFAREEILHDLDDLLTLDDQQRRKHGATFFEAEFAFGTPGREPVTVNLSRGPLHFRGRIDRVDRCADGSLIVYDYKTGSDTPYRDLASDPLARGRRLQLPIYMLAALQHLGADRVRAGYWFAKSGTKDNPRELPELDARETLEPLLDRVTTLVARGTFPARPGKPEQDTFEHCRFCDYDTLCPGTRGQSWRRKSTHADLADYVALVEGDVDQEDPE